MSAGVFLHSSSPEALRDQLRSSAGFSLREQIGAQDGAGGSMCLELQDGWLLLRFLDGQLPHNCRISQLWSIPRKISLTVPSKSPMFFPIAKGLGFCNLKNSMFK
jgi:hypothetical protein